MSCPLFVSGEVEVNIGIVKDVGKIDAFAPGAKIIHIDIDPSAISKNVVVDVPIVGDAKEVLQELLKIVEPPDTKDWLRQIEKWKKDFPLRYKDDGKLKPSMLWKKFTR